MKSFFTSFAKATKKPGIPLRGGFGGPIEDDGDDDDDDEEEAADPACCFAISSKVLLRFSTPCF